MRSSLILPESPINVSPSLAKMIGLNEAIIIQQIHYWLNPKSNENFFEGRHWVWNTYEQWRKQFPFWGLNTIRRAIAKMEEIGLLISFVKKDFRKLKFYTINYDLLKEMANENGKEVSESVENIDQSFSTQNGQIDMLESNDRAAQNDQIDQPKLARSYNKDTEITYHEITPLSFSQPLSVIAKEEDEEIKKMIATWNETIQAKLNPGTEIFPTPKRIHALKSFAADILKGDTRAWKDFCNQIASKRFLMGHNPSGFKVTLDWALNPDNACKVLEGKYYDKPLPEQQAIQDSPRMDSFEEFKSVIAKGKYQAEWIKISEELAQKIGLAAYKSWFLKAQLAELDTQEAIIQVASPFARNYIISHYNQDLEQAIRAIYPAVRQVSIEVGGKDGVSLAVLTSNLK